MALPCDAKDEQSSVHVFDRHVASGACAPSVKTKPRCPVKGCREKLTFSNSCQCGSCGLKVCLKHRFEDQHECRPTCRQSAGAFGALKLSIRPPPKPGSGSFELRGLIRVLSVLHST
ncbi:unnamed protein product [Durusdinium trenchii]|uniref:AN1-type domain-containing protein n=1 Tax=Durusdinium trenchii TaxID=1381693 RepID=A0ABP0QHR7_9DINO